MQTQEEWGERFIICADVRVLLRSIMTMTTIGYGDITPQVDSERFGIILIFSVNAAIFAYSVSTIIGLALTLNINSMFIQNRRDAVIEIVCQVHVPRIVRKNCMRYFNFKNEFSLAQFHKEGACLLPRHAPCLCRCGVQRAFVLLPISQQRRERLAQPA